jgi:endonuclease III
MLELTKHSSQLYSDTQTFHSEVKKCVTRSVVDDYHLFPPENLQSEIERIEFVKNKAVQLLENAQFLHRAPDSLISTRLQFLASNWTKSFRGKPAISHILPSRRSVSLTSIV